jgi:uncharacterized protein YPO0396
MDNEKKIIEEYILIYEEVENLKNIQSDLEKRLIQITKELCEKRDALQKIASKIIPIYEKSKIKNIKS